MMSFLFNILLCITLLFATTANAQLSGTYTIGGSGSNYSTIGAAVSDLTSNGVSGVVTFNVAAGTYSESVTIGVIKGVSASKTITFKGAGSGKSIIIQSSSTKPIVYLDSASYVIFNGFTIQNTNLTGDVFGLAFASYCSILNSSIIDTKGGGLSFSLYSTDGNHITISGCYVYGGSTGVYFSGANGTASKPEGNNMFSNNKVVAFGDYGVYVLNSVINCVTNCTYTNNIIDSAYPSYPYGNNYVGFISIDEGGATYSNNKVLAKVLNSFYAIEPNIAWSTPFKVYNCFFTGYTHYGIYVQDTAGSNISFAFNTIYSDSSHKSDACILVNTTAKITVKKAISIQSNILEQLNTNDTGTNALMELIGSPLAYNTIDGNDLYSSNESYGYLFGTKYKDYASYKKVMAANNWETHATSIKPVYVNPPSDLHLNQTVAAPLGVYTGVTTDIDGNPRCKLFPTAGAHESSYQKGKPTAKFTFPSVIYPGSPTVVTQTSKPGEPKLYVWYLNGVLVSDSITLLTTKFVKGVDSLRLVVTSCGGSDTYTATDTVKAPKAVPAVDFLSNYNSVQTSGIVSFTDLSTNGPSSWHWEITPVYSGSAKAYNYVLGDSNYYDPQVQFFVPGKYEVCLTTGNSAGNGTQNCKIGFITVYAAINIGAQPVANDSAGYLYDDCGPNSPYISNGGTHTILINPCADTVYLTFSKFDLYCGNAYLKIYEGRDNTGKLLGSCSLGFTGGPTFTCASSCLPNVTKPDTFKAKNFMFIEMTDGANNGAAGFAAHWWSKLKKGSNPKPSFTTSESGDSVCIGHRIVFKNTTKIDPNDPPQFFWAVSNFGSFPCQGNCAITVDSFNVTGQIAVTLIASSCGGTDSTSRTVTVYNPFPPIADFTVDNRAPALTDYVFLSPVSNVCIDDYKWSFKKSSLTDTGSAIFVNGTSSISSNPIVLFSDTGYYDVTLYVDNNMGIQRNTGTKFRYIYVRQPYCTPDVISYNSDIGISKVVFGQIINYTKQASNPYSSFVNTPSLSTSVQLGLTYPITVQRNSPASNKIIRTVYIDWNQDGVFSSSEKVAVDSGSTSISWTQNIKVPSSATLGATVMRIAVNTGASTNTPCGPNKFGEFQDYRIYVQPYTTKPVITLKGKDTMYLELGYKYIEPGYSAYSALNGDITSLVLVTSAKLSGIPFPGGEIYAYSVMDSGYQQALTKYRVVLYVKDTIAPTLVVAGPDTTKSEIFTPVHYPKVIADSDLVTKILHPVMDTSKVNHNAPGIYPVYYTLTDSAGNKTVVVRYIDIVDTAAPVLKLKGSASDTIAASSVYKDSGVVVTDNYYRISLLDSLVKTSFSPSLNVNALGIYVETYSLTDPSGNKAKPVTRKIVVVDKTSPVITFNGAADDSVEVFTQYTDPGVTVTDNISKSNQITVTILGSFFVHFPSGRPDSLGTFTIIYVARDQAGNPSFLTRNVKVVDRIGPVITLKGDQSPPPICRWHKYIDSGYTVSDNYDSVKYIKIDTIGTFITNGGTSLEGNYSLAYMAIDRSGNKTISAYRGITVLSEKYSQCYSGILPGLSPDKYVSVYPNPGPGVFVVSMNFPPDDNGYAIHAENITVTDVLGRKVATIGIEALNNNSFRVDLNDRQSGIYFLNIIAGNQKVVKRIEILR